MKKLTIYTLFICTTVFAAVSCKKDFGELNTDPSVVTVPDVNSLFAHSMDNIESYQGTGTDTGRTWNSCCGFQPAPHYRPV